MNAASYWPGTHVPKSTNNGFTLGLSHGGEEWKKLIASDAQRAHSAELAERRRANGTDTSTFHGMSNKSDAAQAPHGGAFTRARPRPNTKSSRLRSMLKDGPMSGVDLARLMGVKHGMVRKLLQYDMEQGRVVQVRDTKPFSYALTEVA